MKMDVDAAAVLRTLVAAHGTQKATAHRLKISEAHVNDLLHGRRKFSDAMLSKLGLRRTVIERTR